MTGEKDGMVSMFVPDTWSGKTSQEHSAPTEAKTSKPSSRKSPGSKIRTALMCLCLRMGGGLKPDVSTVKWETGLLPIGSTMLNIGEFRSEENGLLSLPTSTDSRLPKFSLTLNCGDKPRIPNPTKLSDILEPEVDPKYNLSAKACQGILNRAAKRGKELPEALLDALTEQAGTNLNSNNVVRIPDRNASRTQDADGRMRATQQKPSEHLVGANQQKQTLSCANHYDPQSERVYYGDGAWHSLSSNSGGGRTETPSSQAHILIRRVWLAIGLDHVLLSGGTTFQGRGWYYEVSGCLKTMPHGVMTYETDGS